MQVISRFHSQSYFFLQHLVALAQSLTEHVASDLTVTVRIYYRQQLFLRHDLNHLCFWKPVCVLTSHLADDTSPVVCSVSTRGICESLPEVGHILCAIWYSKVGLKKIYVSFKTITGFLDSSLELAISCTSIITLPWLLPESTYNSTCSKQNSPVSHQTHPFSWSSISNSSTTIFSRRLTTPVHLADSMALFACTTNQLPRLPILAFNSLLLNLSSYYKETMPIRVTILFFPLPKMVLSLVCLSLDSISTWFILLFWPHHLCISLLLPFFSYCGQLNTSDSSAMHRISFISTCVILLMVHLFCGV